MINNPKETVDRINYIISKFYEAFYRNDEINTCSHKDNL